MIIGITGGTGCGKTTFLEQIRRQGGVIYDCDAIYHEMLQTDGALLAALKNRFPESFSNGKLERKALGQIVFSNKEALADLNKITHKIIGQKISEMLTHDMPKLAAIDAIALLEAGLDRFCDITVAITAPYDVRIMRLMKRDNITEDYARSRIAAQHQEQWFCERVDYVLENSGTEEEFRNKCVTFLKQLQENPGYRQFYADI